MAKTYFSGLSDTDLAKDVIAERPYVYIQKYEHIGTGVFASTTGAVCTLTPATSPGWVTNEFTSTTALNLIIYDDNGKVASGKVASNTASAITFSQVAMVLDEDGVTAPTLTIGNSYEFYVLTPSTTTGRTYGPFFGFTEGVELTITDEFMKFKHGQPMKMAFKDLKERVAQITGGHINFENTDVIEDLFGAVTYGSQTGQYSYGIGTDPDTDRYYRITFIGRDRNNRQITIICRKCQFEATGNIFNQAESGHYMMPFSVDLTSDGFYPADVDLIQVIRAS